MSRREGGCSPCRHCVVRVCAALAPACCAAAARTLTLRPRPPAAPALLCRAPHQGPGHLGLRDAAGGRGVRGGSEEGADQDGVCVPVSGRVIEAASRRQSQPAWSRRWPAPDCSPDCCVDPPSPQVREIIGPFAAPDVIHWAPGLPKTRSGKIMRRVLRKVRRGEAMQSAWPGPTCLAACSCTALCAQPPP